MEMLKNVLKTEEYWGSAQVNTHTSYSVCSHCYFDHVYDTICD